MSEEKKTVELNDEELEKVSGGGQPQPGWTVIYDSGKYCPSFNATKVARENVMDMACINCTHCHSFGSNYCDLGKTPNLQT